MPTNGGFDHISGFNHPTDADFLALEDIVYGFTRRLREDDSDSDDSEEGVNRWLRCRPNSSLHCPVCKAVHAYAEPGNSRVSEDNRYSHDARVVYASFGCPICLEDPAGPPMVVLPCGHAVCQDDFRLLGGKTTNTELDAQVRQAANIVTEQHRETISRNQPPRLSSRFPPFLRGGRDGMDQITMAMMHAFASSLNEAMETTGTGSNNNNTNQDEDSDLSTDSDMPELVRRPVYSFSSDDDVPSLRARNISSFSSDDDDDDDDDNDDVPPLVAPRRFPGLHVNPSNFYARSTLFPAIEMLRYNRHIGPARNRRNNNDSESDEDDDSDDDDYDDDHDDSEYNDPEEVIWRLGEYHPGNAVLSDPPNHPGFPKLGQWLLVPEVADNNKVNLMYYCEYEEENNLFVSKQYPRGTRMIPNGKHGVYVYTPQRQNNENARRQWPARNSQWDVFYAKNSKPDSNSRPGRVRGRQESAQALSTTVSEPTFRYKVPKNAQLVADGKGGLWALCYISSLPDSLASQVAPLEDTNGDSNDSDSNNTTRRRQRNQRAGGLRLVYYSRQDRDGVLVGGVFPSSCKIFMNISGGVILLKPNEESTSSSTSAFSSLWHISDQTDHPQTLLYGGLPRRTKVVGDASGSSVFLLSSGGRLQSILTRVMLESTEPSTEDPTLQAVRSITSFSYDLDLSTDAIQDIVDIAQGEKNRVFIHARMPNTNGSQGFQWKLCRVSPRTETAGERDVNVVALDTDCPRSSRIVSDRESGVWVWKKPAYHVSPGDRCFLHVHSSADGQKEWNSPCVFPPHTHLAALG